MADEIDLANILIEGEVSRALKKLRQSSTHNAKGSKWCGECGDKIPLERQKMGFSLCVPCAEEAERRKSLFADD